MTTLDHVHNVDERTFPDWLPMSRRRKGDVGERQFWCVDYFMELPVKRTPRSNDRSNTFLG
ncbi:hypothetical protein, partial [Lapillicoccus sp.]|uniref:hypothetical protein n=1 Tax=Lapillicoccus sp. TaxID=1909287 RepID=UPI0032641668